MADGEKDPRMYFAAERTFLAWIRTGIGLMGIGFAVARFGLFLRGMQSSQSHMQVHSSGASVYGGTALVALGVLVQLGAMANHITTTRNLQSGTLKPGISYDGMILAAVLAVAGLGMGVYLLLIR